MCGSFIWGETIIKAGLQNLSFFPLSHSLLWNSPHVKVEFLQAKRELIEQYYGIYQHATDMTYRRRLAQVF